MTNMSYEQLELEYMRQIRLCSGVGKWRMVELILSYEFIFPEAQLMPDGEMVIDVLGGPSPGRYRITRDLPPMTATRKQPDAVERAEGVRDKDDPSVWDAAWSAGAKYERERCAGKCRALADADADKFHGIMHDPAYQIGCRDCAAKIRKGE